MTPLASRVGALICVMCAILTASGAKAAGQISPAAARQVAQVQAAVERYADIAVARAEGWRRHAEHAPLMGEHWGHRDAPDYVTGDTLDFSRPSNLVYAEIGGQHRLVAVSFNVRLAPGDPLPEGFSGSADHWHVHNGEEIADALAETRPFVAWLARGWLEKDFARDGRTRLAMVHVWLGNNPDGPFALVNRTLPYARVGLTGSGERATSLAAARGVALAHPDGCENELRVTFGLGDLPRDRQREIRQICAQAAARVRSALQGPARAAERIAADAFCRFDAERAARMTPRERARVAAIGEGHHGSVCAGG